MTGNFYQKKDMKQNVIEIFGSIIVDSCYYHGSLSLQCTTCYSTEIYDRFFH